MLPLLSTLSTITSASFPLERGTKIGLLQPLAPPPAPMLGYIETPIFIYIESVNTHYLCSTICVQLEFGLSS